MGLTTSLHTGLTGLDANSQKLNVAGNNISNVNTHGYKKSRISFETAISENLKQATGPDGELGGTNPAQIGLGTKTAAVTKDFSNGSLQPTGVNTDMAIEGEGFFSVRQGGTERYTRAGNFDLDKDFNLVTPDGWQVQGYGVDDNFQLVQGQLETVNIPLGNMTIAEATETVRLGGNLNASGEAATQGSLIESGPLTDGSTGGAADASTDLTDLEDGSGTGLFNNNDVIALRGASKGGLELPEKTFRVGAPAGDADDNGTQLGDLTSFLESSLGINDGVGGAGVAVNGGQIEITGNSGEVNDLDVSSTNIVNTTGTPGNPFDLTKQNSADGESQRTTFGVFDSLGQQLNINMSMVLENKDSTGTTWRYYAESEDDTDLNRAMDTGTLEFDTNGELQLDQNPTITIDRENTGAESPQSIELAFSAAEEGGGELTALSDESSSLSTLSQDGSAVGTLQDFSISEDGTIVGQFSNSLTRTLGQVATARFSNPEGLAEEGGNRFQATVNSGQAQIGAPGEGGRGRVIGSTLEQSNVDISEEFVDMISAQTGFQANSRIIQTSSQLMQQLLNNLQ